MKYISLLRGINVAGQKKIKMADLKSLYEKEGFFNVITYIQSGNVIYESTINDKSEQQTIIEKAITKKYEFNVPINVIEASDFKKILKGLPFKNIDIEQDGTKILITFLSSPPALEKIDALQQFVVSPEKLIINQNVAYLHCPNGYGRTKLSNTLIEKKLGVTATTRNIKSVIKLCELAHVNEI